jgi:hypothetical protein
MYIAYSALRETKGKAKAANEKISQRHRAYLAACNKYSNEITAIQKYFPGWMPALEIKG